MLLQVMVLWEGECRSFVDNRLAVVDERPGYWTGRCCDDTSMASRGAFRKGILPPKSTCQAYQALKLDRVVKCAKPCVRLRWPLSPLTCARPFFVQARVLSLYAFDVKISHLAPVIHSLTQYPSSRHSNCSNNSLVGNKNSMQSGQAVRLPRTKVLAQSQKQTIVTNPCTETCKFARQSLLVVGPPPWSCIWLILMVVDTKMPNEAERVIGPEAFSRLQKQAWDRVALASNTWFRESEHRTFHSFVPILQKIIFVVQCLKITAAWGTTIAAFGDALQLGE